MQSSIFATHHRVMLTFSTAVTLTTGLPATLTWDKVFQDTLGIFNPNDPTKIPLPKGFNLIKLGCTLAFANNAIGSRKIEFLQTNSNMFPSMFIQLPPTSGAITVINFNTPWSLCSENDFFEVSVTQTSGGNLNLSLQTNPIFYAEFGLY